MRIKEDENASFPSASRGQGDTEFMGRSAKRAYKPSDVKENGITGKGKRIEC